MAARMSRRAFTLGATGGLATIVAGRAAPRADNDLANLNLPTIDLTITSEAYENLPAGIAAGRYHVVATLAEGVTEGAAAFMQPPAGVSAEAFLALFGLGKGDEQSDTVPAVSEAERRALVYQSIFAGGPVARPGAPGEAVVDLPPGEWILWGETAPQPPMTFRVTGEMPSRPAAPEADIDVRYRAFSLALAGSLTPGDHLLRIVNRDAQPHFLYLAQGPVDMTDDEAEILFANDVVGHLPPEALPLNPQTDLTPVLLTTTQSVHTQMWLPVHLDAGTYLGACFFPNEADGLPHTFHGMYTVFTVA